MRNLISYAESLGGTLFAELTYNSSLPSVSGDIGALIGVGMFLDGLLGIARAKEPYLLKLGKYVSERIFSREKIKGSVNI